MKYVVGVDIGTSSTKSVLFDTNGRQVAQCAQRYALRSPEPGAAEQDANEILQAATQTIATVIGTRGIAADQLLGLSLSCAMHTLLLLNSDNQPITPLFTWADNRSDRWAAQIRQQEAQNLLHHLPPAPSSLYERTGIPVHPMSPVIKLVWLRCERPEIFSQAARVVCIKEYVLWHWCCEWVIDYSMASTTGLLSLHSGLSDGLSGGLSDSLSDSSSAWDTVAMNLAGIQPHQLSALVPTTHTLAMQSPYADKTGVRVGTPVVVGASDGVLANLGVGAIAPEMAAITLGTSGAVRKVVSQPTTAPEVQLFCYALSEGRWVMGGAVNNGGIALQWARDHLVPYSMALTESPHQRRQPTASTYEQITALAQTIAPGSDGLIFHPYLLGERAPLWNAQARASFFGLSHGHTQAHLVRAVMEGVLYNLQSVFTALEKAGGKVTTLRASGGFAHSLLWQQMLADIFDRQIEIPTVIESSAFGAAALALVALGEWESLTTVGEKVVIAKTRSPIAKNVSRYQKILPLYSKLAADFAAHYDALQQIIGE